ncbi:MAG: hypothetical protein L6R38_002933 [Xanthoria sp. 2 TBL-2021]|nr:MAG: hypothetical protein L6R38_002933 [Xanthoria sp. 2 TBL-2021]
MYPLTPFALLLSLLPLLTRAVSVSLEYGQFGTQTHTRVGVQVCRNLRPGRCCQGRPIPEDTVNPFYVPPPHEDYRVAQWTNLGPLDVASVWQAGANGEGGCSGMPLSTIGGPGSWRYPAIGIPQSQVILTGASYIKLPQGQPKYVDAPWLEAEGVFGLVTGGGEWVFKKASYPVTQQALNWRTLTYGISKRRKRGVVAGEKGLVLAQPPPKANSVFVDLIVYDGKEYTAESEGSPIYRTQAGEILDFTKS